MKHLTLLAPSTLLAIAIVLSPFSSQALGLHCKNAEGYEITESRGLRSPWPKLSVTKNGALIMSGLRETLSSFVAREYIPASLEKTISASRVVDGVRHSAELLVRYKNQQSGRSTANVIFRKGNRVAIVVDFNCLAQ